MPARRGEVAGLSREQVRDLLLRATGILRRRGEAQFGRADLRIALHKAGAPDESTMPLEFAFFRTVAPVKASERAKYILPEATEELLRNRDFRLPLVRLDLGSTMQLTALLRTVPREDLTPLLQSVRERGETTMRSLSLEPYLSKVRRG